MCRPIEISFASSVAADREEVWQSISTMAGVNFELRPLVGMTSPLEIEALPAEVPGQTTRS